MGLSQSDTRQLAAFVRKVTKAPDEDAIISETFQVLKSITKINRLRVVYSPGPGRWTEWKTTTDTIEVWSHDEWPEPEKKVFTAFFDPDVPQSGFLSTSHKRNKVRPAFYVLAPQVWTALLLRSAVDRAQRTSVSEAGLVRATLRARDEERRHIARELHDDLGQSLASLKLGLKWTEDQVREKKKSTTVLEELSRARQDVGVMLDKIRDLSHTLYPRILDTLGLTAAVKELAHQAARFSPMRVECATKGKPRPLAREVEIALYRCCQEAINNAIRHSEAKRLGIVLRFARTEIRVTVEDNGRGFNPRTLYDSNSRMMSSGFWTIRQRMADIGAAFRVSTADGHGTVVEMIVPYSSGETHVNKRKNNNTTRR
jgi:signal transduction histidine kinase